MTINNNEMFFIFKFLFLPPGFPTVPQYFKHYRLYSRMVLEISQSLRKLSVSILTFRTQQLDIFLDFPFRYPNDFRKYSGGYPVILLHPLQDKGSIFSDFFSDLIDRFFSFHSGRSAIESRTFKGDIEECRLSDPGGWKSCRNIPKMTYHFMVFSYPPVLGLPTKVIFCSDLSLRIHRSMVFCGTFNTFVISEVLFPG